MSLKFEKLSFTEGLLPNQNQYWEESSRDSPPRFHQSQFGQWDDKQTLKYFLFVYHHRKKFQTKSSRKSLKVFKQMAKFIGSRNSSQCRTHHQNILLKTHDLQDSIDAYITDNPKFLKIYETNKEKLLYLQDLEFCEDTSTVVKKADNEALLPPQIPNLWQSSPTFGFPKETIGSTCIEGCVFQPPVEQANNTCQEDWQECQELFMIWTSKLKSLLEKGFVF